MSFQAVILDATFDNLTPLAGPRMPACLENVIKHSIEDNVDLDVASQISKYHGPVRYDMSILHVMYSTFLTGNRPLLTG